MPRAEPSADLGSGQKNGDIDCLLWGAHSTREGVHTENPGLPIRPFDNLMADLRVFRCLLRVILGVGRDPIATAASREPAGIDHRDW